MTSRPRSSHLRNLGQASSTLASGMVLSLVGQHSTIAQIVPDTTLGPENSVVTPNVQVRGGAADQINGGAQRGAYLFHSFQQFGVESLQRVYFSNPDGVESILTRVTGNDPSRILGTLGVDGPASLLLMNPKGIVFGPNARLDIAGSFVGTTASTLKVGEDLEFNAVNPNIPSVLTINLRPGIQLGDPQVGSTILSRGNLSVGQNLALIADQLDLQGQLIAGNNLNLQAGNSTKIRDTATTPFIAQAGNQLLIQGNQSLDIFALNHPASQLVSRGDLVLRSMNTVGGDAHFWAGGNFRIEELDGTLGSLWSPDDPVIRASGDVSFQSYSGNSLHIFAGGSVNIPGDITIVFNGNDPTNGINQDVTLSLPLPDGTTQTETVPIRGRDHPTLDIRAGMQVSEIGTAGLTPNPIPGADPPIPTTTVVPTSSNITIGSITNRNFNARILLTNQYKPNPALNEGAIRITGSTTQPDFPQPFSIVAFTVPVTIAARGDVFIQQGIVTGTSGGFTGGDIRIFSGGNIDVSGGRLFSQTSDAQSGSIKLAALGNINTGDIDTKVLANSAGNAGAIEIDAGGTITGSGSISSRAIGSGDGSRITLTSTNGGISVLSLISEGNTKGGNVLLSAKNDITTGEIVSQARATTSGEAGDIKLTSTAGFIQVNGALDSEGGIRGGDVILTAPGNITTRAIRSQATLDTAADNTPIDQDPLGNDFLGIAGTINLTSTAGLIQVLGEINAKGFYDGGIVILKAAGSVETRGITTESPGRLGYGKPITITSDTSTINTMGQTLRSEGILRGGAVTLTASGRIDTGNITSRTINNPAFSRGAFIDAGDIKLTSTAGSIAAGQLESYSDKGMGGNIQVLAQGGMVTLGSAQSFVGTDAGGTLQGGDGKAGTITIGAQNGVSSGSLRSFSGADADNSGNEVRGGDITVSTTTGEIQLSSYVASFVGSAQAANGERISGGKGTAGLITITNGGGGVTSTAASIVNSFASFTGEGTAGDIKVDAVGDITIKGIDSRVTTTGEAGTITLSSASGAIDTSQGSLISEGVRVGGSIALQAQRSITTGAIISKANDLTIGKAGNITLTSGTGFIQTNGALDSAGTLGGGEVKLTASDRITTQSITTQALGPSGFGGPITLLSQTATIDTTGGILSSRGFLYGGAIKLTAAGLITTNEITSQGTGELSQGGQITFTSLNGGITTLGKTTSESPAFGGDIEFQAQNGIQTSDMISQSTGMTGGTAGNIRLTSLAGSIDTSNASLNSRSNGVAGSVTLLAELDVIAGNIASTSQGTSVGSGGLITLTSQTGNIQVPDNKLISSAVAGSASGGEIRLTASQGAIETGDNAAITASTSGSGVGGNLTLIAADAITGQNTTLSARTTGSGNAGLIQLQTTDPNGSGIQFTGGEIDTSVRGLGTGSGNQIQITAPIVELTQVKLSADTLSALGGNSLGIEITAPTVILAGAQLGTTTNSNAGEAGLINITASDRLEIRDRSTLAASTTTNQQAGNITLVTPLLSMSGDSTIKATTSGSGNGGSVAVGKDLPATRIHLTNSQIEASSSGPGQAGSVFLRAAESITLQGEYNTFDPTQGVIAGGISVQATGTGDAGRITIDTPQLILTDRSEIAASTVSGAGQNIQLQNINQLQLTDSVIAASTQTGIAGSILLNDWADGQPASNSVTLVNSELSVAATTIAPPGRGIAGNVLLNTRQLSLDNAKISASTITGKAGNLTVSANGGASDWIQLANQSELSLNAGDDGTIGGTAGNITLKTRDLTLTGDSPSQGSVITAATTLGAGENITLQNLETLTLVNSRITAATEQGQAGNITLNQSETAANRVSLNQSELAVKATIGAGKAGAIALNTQKLALQQNSVISASSVAGTSEGITIQNVEDLTVANSLIAASTETGTASRLTINEGDPKGTVTLQGQMVAADGKTEPGGLSVSAEGEGGRAGSVLVNARQVTIRDGAKILAASTSGTSGDIALRGLDHLSMNQGEIAASTQTGVAGNMTIEAASLVEMSNGSLLSVTADGSGTAGDLTIQTRRLVVDPSFIVAETQTGKAGNVTLNATDSMEIVDNSRVSVRATQAGGTAGNLEIQTGRLQVDRSEVTVSSVSQRAGNLSIQAPTLSLNQGNVSAETQTGIAGNVTLNATNATEIANNSQVSVRATQAGGTAGNLEIQTGRLQVDRSEVTVSSVSQRAGNLSIQAPTLSLNQGNVSAETQTGIAGNVTLNATDATEIANNSQVSVRATQAGGTAGNLGIQTGRLQVDRSEVTVSSVSQQAGNLSIQAQTLSLNQGNVSAETQTGIAGNVTVNVAQTTELRGGSKLSVEAQAGGTAGNLTVNTDRLRLNGRSQISVSSPVGNAGNLTVVTNSLVMDQSVLSAETGGSGGNGANISVTIPEQTLNPLLLRNGSRIEANAFGAANGGNVRISAPFLIGFPDENSDITATARQGNGGRININSFGVFGLQFRRRLTPFSDITASSEFGREGIVNIQTLDVDPGKGLAALPSVPIDPTRQVAAGCSPTATANSGRFTVTGRGGLPPTPEESPNSVATWEDVPELSPTATQPPDADPTTAIARGQGSTPMLLSATCYGR